MATHQCGRDGLPICKAPVPEGATWWPSSGEDVDCAHCRNLMAAEVGMAVAPGRGVFVEVALQTAQGDDVVTGLLPPFDVMPDVLMWGTRFFKRDRTGGGLDYRGYPVYRECFVVAVVNTA